MGGRQAEGKENTQRDNYPKSASRRVNAWLSLGISALFLLHSVLGALFLLSPNEASAPKVLLWMGVLLILAHILVSVVSTEQMLSDTVRPPSARKKRHQMKKWISGALLLLAAGTHAGAQATGVLHGKSVTVLMAAVSVLLCFHLCTGAKSFTRDMDLSANFRWPIRILAASVSVLVCGCALAALL